MSTVYFVYLLQYPNGKVYIGMSKTDKKGLFTSRYRDHKRCAKNGNHLPVYNAWRKYGAPPQVILSTHLSREECALAEIDEIEKYDSINKEKGYNILGGGQGQSAGCNPRIYAIMREKVWDNPEWRKKVSEALKGRRPSDEALEASRLARKSDTGWRDKISLIQNDPEFKAIASARTKSQMANGGAAHLSEKFKGRQDVRSAKGKESQRTKTIAYLNTPEGKASARRGYEAFKANPENVANNQAALDVWRKSDANKAQMQEATKKAIEKCSRPVRDSETGVIYQSQRDMAKALGVSDALISLRVKKDIVTRI